MRIALVLSLFLLSACSAADALNATITREGYDVRRDIAYGPDARQKLDLYIPHAHANAPMVVFFYGGSWQQGDKDDYRFLGQAFASKGFITAVVDYRIYPSVRFPSFVEDAARATTYLHRHAPEFGGNAHALYVAGHSAGAYMAMMIGADPAYMHQAGGKQQWIQGIIGIAGPYDFLPLTDDTLKHIFATAPDAETQPINHIQGKIAPVFLATGDADDTVDPRNSARVTDKLTRLNSPVEQHVYEDVGHIGIILSLAEGFRSRAPLLEDIARFVQRTNPASTPRGSKNENHAPHK